LIEAESSNMSSLKLTNFSS